MSDTSKPEDVDPVTSPDAKAPAPRPRSATSRARRIGGAAAPPRPDSVDDAAAKAQPSAAVDMGKKAAKSSAARGKATPSVTGDTSTNKPGTKPAGRAAPTTEGGGFTFSVPEWARWAPTFVFAAVAVVFLTLFAVARIGGDAASATTSDTTRQEVLAAAKTCLATLNTYRYDQLDAAEAAGRKCTTGKLTSDYAKTVATVIRKNAPALKAVQLAKINTAGIESVTSNGKQWTVLAYGQLNITTANTGAKGQVDPFAVLARLQQVNGKWVLSKIDTVSSFSR